MNRVDIHHILVDGQPLCKLADNETWAQFFTCYYQWEPTARQVATKISSMALNKDRKVEVVRGPCVCGR